MAGRNPIIYTGTKIKIIIMNKIPSKKENPNGLHGKYYIQKIIPHPKAGELKNETKWSEVYFPESMLAPVDPESEYFVLRLDEGGKDPEHIKACRIGVNAYADAIQHRLPELSKDLKERYPLSPIQEGEEWLTEKPEFTDECILIVANKWNNPQPHWEYTLYTVEKVITDEGWYWGLMCDDGNEWGDIEDLKADRYKIVKPIN